MPHTDGSSDSRTTIRRTPGSARDVSVEEHDGEKLLRVVVPFAEAGERWGDPPEVRLSTAQAARYEEAIAVGQARTDPMRAQPTIRLDGEFVLEGWRAED